MSAAEQLPLALPKRAPSRADRFADFHARNPHIYLELVRFARQVKAAGRSRIGIRLVWERLRWDLMLTTDSDDWKLNDHLTAPYARLIMEQEADLAGIFEVRERK